MYSIKRNAAVLMNGRCEFIVNTVDNILHDYALHAVITSGIGGNHGINSHHYEASALDFRTRTWDKALTPSIVKRIKDRLGPDYDVVLEKDHLHVEFDPKG